MGEEPQWNLSKKPDDGERGKILDFDPAKRQPRDPMDDFHRKFADRAGEPASITDLDEKRAEKEKREKSGKQPRRKPSAKRSSQDGFGTTNVSIEDGLRKFSERIEGITQNTVALRTIYMKEQDPVQYFNDYLTKLRRWLSAPNLRVSPSDLRTLRDDLKTAIETSTTEEDRLGIENAEYKKFLINVRSTLISMAATVDAALTHQERHEQ